MSSCHPACHSDAKQTYDYLLIVSSSIIVVFYVLTYAPFKITSSTQWLGTFTFAIHDLVNTMAWGVGLGIVFIGLIGRVPREFVIAILGDKTGIKGLLRATLAGVLLDLCSHGILMVGTKLYERGASTAQVMAFLIASPWNSFSFTLILWAMVGFFYIRAGI